MKRFLCKIKGHDLIVVKTYCFGTCQKLYCRRCKRFFGINHNVRVFIPWDSGLEHSMKFDEKMEEQRVINEIEKQ